ncbi:MAG: efflux RND transporter periplasmic adaptor subunit [Bacteroidota bacterium]|nr:efflux RND transporter periplasmic adaptor subunit [Bacteroidota bacterium]
MKKTRTYLIIGIIALVLIILVVARFSSIGNSADARRSTVPIVKVEHAARENVEYKLQFNGDVIAIQQANIFSKVSGNLERVLVDMGSRVRRNQLLAVIDPTELYQQVQQTAATYANARIIYRRNEELLKQNLIAKQDRDNAEAAMKVALANYENAKTKLGYTRITAPFSGFITKRYLDPGALVTGNNSTLFSLMDLSSVKVIVNVLEKDIPLISPGKKAIVAVDAFPGKNYDGTISRLSEAVDLSTRTMAVEIDIPNEDNSLKPGMFATVTLVVAQHPDAVTVPTYSLMKDNVGQFVFALSSKGSPSDSNAAKKIRVKTGIEIGTRTEITSGLTGGETIITTGQQFLHDGSPVTVQQ